MKIKSIAVASDTARIDVLFDGKVVMHAIPPHSLNRRILISVCAGKFKLLEPFPGVVEIGVLSGLASIAAEEVSSERRRPHFKFELKSGKKKGFTSRTMQVEIETSQFTQILIKTESPTESVGSTPENLGKHP